MKIDIIKIDPELSINESNLMCLCGKCIKSASQGFISKSELKYIHKVFMNKMERTIR